jgi:hypothetical protein
VRRLLTFLLFSVVVSAAPADRIVAIADVHGGFEPFVSILTATKLIDSQRHWAGGQAVFVQTGDLTDRGPGVREALDLMMALEKEADSAGGKVHALLGNHEIMNMLGDTRDVAPEVLAAFGGESAYRDAFGRDGRYGKWLRSKPAATSIDGTVFMHAGINLEFADVSLDDLNKRVKREIQEWDEGRKWLVSKNLIPAGAPFLEVVQAARAELDRLNTLVAAKKEVPPDAPQVAALLQPISNIGSSSLLSGEGPMWFRGFASWTEAEGPAKMSALLSRYRVKRFVTGHNALRDGRIIERFAGSLFLIDTGMLNGKFYPSGRASALEITSAGVKQIYPE